MSGLMEFLLARIAEDEEWARPANGIWGMDVTWHRPEVLHERGINRADSAHIARWDPARVLGECEAKRLVLAIHQPYDPDSGLCAGCDGRYDVEDCPNLRAIALPYVNHSDYRDEWRP